MAFWKLEPWGDMRADLRAGIVAATIANAFRAKGHKAISPWEMMPKFGAEKKPRQSIENQKAAFKAFARACERNPARGDHR